MDNVYAVSAAPHLHEKTSVSSIMWWVAAALMPALGASMYFFGMVALWLTLIGVTSAVVTEALIQWLRKQPVTVTDGSAVVTGILMSFNLHAASPWWLPAVGSVFAIAIGKQVFGGLGHNPMNPALLGRAFLVASWPGYTTGGFIKTTLNSISGLGQQVVDTMQPAVQSLVTSATPLQVMKSLANPDWVASTASTVAGQQEAVGEVVQQMTSLDTISNLFFGNVGGVIGEVSAAALLVGAAVLAFKHIIEWRIPLSYIATVFVLTFIFGDPQGHYPANIMLPVFHIFAGGLILGAFFMATDMVTSPVTKRGRIVFGIGCGVITVVIRLVGGYPEGVSYSILLMNLAVPLIDKATMPKHFGEVAK